MVTVDDAVWRMVGRERLSLADLLAGLTARQWEQGSLCTRWRVKDVAAHLVMTPLREPPVRTLAGALVRQRGHLWDAGWEVVVTYADRRPCEGIVADLRSEATSRERPVFVRDANILFDLVVHGQDVAVPLGIERPVPADTAVVALDRAWATGWPFHARRRLGRTRLEAEDCAWAAGEGPRVTGSAGDLLLLATGRTGAALERLRGPGLDALRSLTPR
ncbi:maleylpyruvate isomerase family mycothiol-dependent enzyme [Kineococcus aurantiacus]|uniref:Uncharacterized protein (TIGR03083 family) n=1 Tax=Kineococcus aurantiacus TaxID=37633 RepID=A0A7Y9J0L3_9ACTN|nr:uncharacterized protein (TIGR03083 family) [Kineococcus aurantiacus]